METLFSRYANMENRLETIENDIADLKTVLDKGFQQIEGKMDNQTESILRGVAAYLKIR